MKTSFRIAIKKYNTFKKIASTQENHLCIHSFNKHILNAFYMLDRHKQDKPVKYLVRWWQTANKRNKAEKVAESIGVITLKTWNKKEAVCSVVSGEGKWRVRRSCPQQGQACHLGGASRSKGCEGAWREVRQPGLRGNYVGSFESLQGLWLLFWVRKEATIGFWVLKWSDILWLFC